MATGECSCLKHLVSDCGKDDGNRDIGFQDHGETSPTRPSGGSR